MIRCRLHHQMYYEHETYFEKLEEFSFQIFYLFYCNRRKGKSKSSVCERLVLVIISFFVSQVQNQTKQMKACSRSSSSWPRYNYNVLVWATEIMRPKNVKHEIGGIIKVRMCSLKGIDCSGSIVKPGHHGQLRGRSTMQLNSH